MLQGAKYEIPLYCITLPTNMITRGTATAEMVRTASMDEEAHAAVAEPGSAPGYPRSITIIQGSAVNDAAAASGVHIDDGLHATTAGNDVNCAASVSPASFAQGSAEMTTLSPPRTTAPRALPQMKGDPLSVKVLTSAGNTHSQFRDPYGVFLKNLFVVS